MSQAVFLRTLRQGGFAWKPQNILLLASLTCLTLAAGCSGEFKSDKTEGASKTVSDAEAKKPKKHAGVFGFRSMDLYAQGDTVDVLLADGQMGSAFPELRHARSRDGGETWSDLITIDTGGVLPSNPHRGMDAQIAVRGDQLVVAWTGPGGSKHDKGAMATALSSDGGQSWRRGPSVGDENNQDGSSFTDIVSAGDTFHMVWTDGPPKKRELRYTQSADGGRTWADKKTVDSTTCACCWNILGNVGAKKLYGLYRDGTPRDMALAVSNDGGATWDLRGAVGEFGWIFDGCPHIGGGLAIGLGKSGPVLHSVVWTGREQKVGVYYLSSPDEGRTWTEPRQMGDETARRADIAIAGDGTLAAVWDARPDKTYAVYAIFGATSRDSGRTWSPARRLSQAGNATHPKVTFTSKGFRVFWTETDADNYITWKSVKLGKESQTLGDAAVPRYSRGPAVTSFYASENLKAQP